MTVQQGSRNLLAELKDKAAPSQPPEEEQGPHKVQCARDLRCGCLGFGFVLKKGAPKIRVELCECVHRCPKCKGTCIYTYAGEAHMCRRPIPQRIVRLFSEAHLPGRYAEAKFEKDVPAYVEKWVERYAQTGRGLVLSGPPGVGKTHLLVAVAKKLIFVGTQVKYVEFFHLMNELKTAFSEKTSVQELISPLIRAEVLIIDELGKGFHSDLECAILDQLISARYNENKVILAATNYRLKPPEFQKNTELEVKNFGLVDQVLLAQRIDARVYSRLMECCEFFTINGQDRREGA